MKRKTDKQEQKSMELRVLKYFLMAAREENIRDYEEKSVNKILL